MTDETRPETTETENPDAALMNPEVEVERRLAVKVGELVGEANVSGFRPGKAPRRVVEKRFGREVADQVKTDILLASLEQLAEEHDVAPLSAPDLDPSAIELLRDQP